MKKINLIFLLLLAGCQKNIEEQNINAIPIKPNKDLTFEYAETIHLSDIFKNIKSDKIIDTYTLGENKIILNNKEYIYNVVDTIEPVINVSNMTTTVGKNINFENKLMCGDNYDRNLKCEISGDYDFNKPGTYILTVSATDSSNNKKSEKFKLTVYEKYPSSSNNETKYYYFEDLIKKYKNEKTMVGIDVSAWQGDINWKKIKNAGCEFAMIRIGFGKYKDDDFTYDSKFKKNLKEAKDVGIKVGLYFYSYAKTKEDAVNQAKWIVNELDGEKLDLPIAFDWEIWNGFNSYNLNFNDLNIIASSFIEEIDKNGYEGCLYGSAFYTNRVWNKNNKVWLAYYTSNNDYEKPYFMWQLSSIGHIDGINGYVDLNILYK